MNSNFTLAQISGTVGGLLTGRVLTVVNVGSWIETAGLTVLTTTISFVLPLAYKWLLQKYKTRKERK